MVSHRESPTIPSELVPLLVLCLGVLIAILPLIFLPSSSGALIFPVLIMKFLGVMVGVSVAGTGLYSYRTGNHQTAMITGLSVIGLLIVGIIGGFIETSSGYLIPIGLWMLSTTSVIVLAVILTTRFLGGMAH